jgi:hypothetical protein
MCPLSSNEFLERLNPPPPPKKKILGTPLLCKTFTIHFAFLLLYVECTLSLWLCLILLVFHTIIPTGLLHCPPAPHFKTFEAYVYSDTHQCLLELSFYSRKPIGFDVPQICLIFPEVRIVVLFVVIDAPTYFFIPYAVKLVFYLPIKFHNTCYSGQLFIPLKKMLSGSSCCSTFCKNIHS